LSPPIGVALERIGAETANITWRIPVGVASAQTSKRHRHRLAKPRRFFGRERQIKALAIVESLREALSYDRFRAFIRN
jgi:hypothetical protein